MNPLVIALLFSISTFRGENPLPQITHHPIVYPVHSLAFSNQRMQPIAHNLYFSVIRSRTADTDTHADPSTLAKQTSTHKHAS